jgi:hypothetical protein
MMRFRRLLPFGLLLGMVWLARADQPAYDEVELNRVQLEKWKKDAPHYARLRRSLTEFLQMPTERQEAMRQLDRDLQAEDSATGARLMRVLDRYADWLNQLPEEDKQAVLKANGTAERLQRIKQIRDHEWIQREPKNVQDQLVRLAPAEQTARISQLRKAEADFHGQWDAAILYQDQFNKLRNTTEKFANELHFFIKESLEPMLTQEEKKQLAEVKDKWPLFEMKLVELADKHPVKLPGPTTGPKKFEELPTAVQKDIRNFKNAQALLANQGHWPEYAEAVITVAARRGVVLSAPLGKCHEAEFVQPIQEFIRKELKPALGANEKKNLEGDEGIWPAYPRRLMNLARAHRLPVPGMALPGPRDVWEAFRRKSATTHDFLPEVDDRTLLDFAKHELTEEERAALPSMALSDPQTREEWKRAYFMRHPEILKQRKRQDIRKEKAAIQANPP